MLSSYHQKYASKPDVELELRAQVKEQELAQIFSQNSFISNNPTVRVAVMGCGDKRFVKLHQVIFEKLLHNPVELCTFDITTEHLQGEQNVHQHDCTVPLPNAPYDITYAHVLLKFIPQSQQWQVVENSYDALRAGGVAIHVLDREDYDPSLTLSDGYKVDLDNIEKCLLEREIPYKKMHIQSGPNGQIECLALVLLKSE